MKTLDQIGIEQQTDKASQFSRTYAKPHDYLRHMELFFAPLRETPIKLVEIGVGGGESVRTWLQYFKWAWVLGIDNVHDTNQWNTPKKWSASSDSREVDGYDRYAFMAADQNDPVFWACFAADLGKTVDIAIDDGSHEPQGIITSFNGLWPLVKPGGYYCIEDLGCGFSSPCFPSHYEWLNSLVNEINRGTFGIDSMYFSKELCVLRKAGI
jgi:hypothetical protein